MNHSHALSRSRIGRRFPFTAYVCKKSCSGWTLFAQHFTAAIAVIPNRGSAHKNLRRPGHLTYCFRDQLRSVHAAVANALLFRGSPTAGGYVFTGEVNNRIRVRKDGSVDPASFRIPMFRAFQPNYAVPRSE